MRTVPLPSAALSGPQSRRALRRYLVDTLLRIATELVRGKPASATDARVVVFVDLADLAASQVVVFFAPSYFDVFWSRATPEQTWTPLPAHRSFRHEWHTVLPPDVFERGYREVVRDGGVVITGEIWAIGEFVGAGAD
jgi:hypothetical protein